MFTVSPKIRRSSPHGDYPPAIAHPVVATVAVALVECPLGMSWANAGVVRVWARTGCCLAPRSQARHAALRGKRMLAPYGETLVRSVLERFDAADIHRAARRLSLAARTSPTSPISFVCRPLL